AWFESGNPSAEGKSEVRSVLPAYLTHVETTFAMTIHKSQGSEYDQVLVVLPDDPEHPILTRELLYTAITRAKSKVIISGSEEQILRCAAREVHRISGIRENLKTTID
ncbi:MAG: ATP-binding domain-containing protein, partial [Cyclobacteriaceae bacterium]